MSGVKDITVVRPTRGWRPLNLRELWHYRGLLYFLIWRDVKVRYKQTVLGVAWAVIQPVFMMIVFTLIFDRLAGLPSEGNPYPVFAFVALLPWNLFVRGLSDAGTSVVGNQQLLTKIYFPRLILPASAVLAALVDLLIAFGVLAGLLLYYGIMPSLALLALPVFLVVAIISAMGIGFWLSAVDARYRDVRHTIPFLTQLWFFATPVVYSMTLVPESWRWFYSLNPMVGVVEGFRWALLGGTHSFDPYLLISMAVAVVMFIGGMFYFRRTERILADVV